MATAHDGGSLPSGVGTFTPAQKKPDHVIGPFKIIGFYLERIANCAQILIMTKPKPLHDALCTRIIELARRNPEVKLLWLYGSRADGTACETSDYDFGVAFDKRLDNPLERRLRPELLAMDWQRAVEAADNVLSIVDINLAPLPLALNIIGDHSKLLLNKDELRYIRELNRIWGLWSDSQWQPGPQPFN